MGRGNNLVEVDVSIGKYVTYLHINLSTLPLVFKSLSQNKNKIVLFKFGWVGLGSEKKLENSGVFFICFWKYSSHLS